MIGRAQLDRVLHVVREAGVGEHLEALLRPDGKGGRPRALSVDVYVAGLILTVLDGRSLELVQVHRTLTQDIARSAQIAIGTRYRRNGQDLAQPITIRQVRYLLEAIDAKLRHTRDTDLDEVEVATRADALQRVLDLVVDSTVPEHLRTAETVTLDATAMDSWGRGKRRPVAVSARDGSADTDATPPDATVETGYSFDPDARWGYRTKTYDSRTSRVFGYDMFALVAAPALGADPDSLPKLIHRITLRPAGLSVVEPALGLIDGLAGAGRSVTEVLADRAWSYKVPESWAEPLRERGIAHVFDLHPGDRGVRDLEGVRMVDGVAHCVAMPDHLIDIARPATLSPGKMKKNATAAEKAAYDARVADIETFHALIEERQQYAFRRVAGPDANGNERAECPAQAGKLKCEHCPMSQFLPDGTPEVENPPAAATRPKACRQRTITIPVEAVAKLRQRHYWGSREWAASYNRRAYVEGAFGTYKSTNRVKRGWCRVVGLVKTSLMAAVVAAATNITLLRAWAARTGDITSPLAAPLPASHGFEELPGPEDAPAAHGPPAVA